MTTKASTIGERWIDSTKQLAASKKHLLIDTLGTELTAIKALAGSIILSKKIKILSPEQNVATLLPTSAGAMLCNLAVLMLGKTLVNLNYTASKEALLSSLRQADIKTIYTSSQFLQKLEARGFDTTWLEQEAKLVILEKLRASTSTFSRLLTFLRCRFSTKKSLKARYLQEADGQSVAAILFSSGSEGQPKGIILTHSNFLTNVDQVMHLLELKADDVVLANLPLFHAFGLTATLFFPMLEGIPVVCHPDPTDAVASAMAIKKFMVTLMFGTSTFFRLYIRNVRITNDMLASLRLIIAGAEKLQVEVRDEFFNKFNKPILEGYGATETSPVACVNIPNDFNVKGYPPIKHKPGSVGLPIPATEICIIDPETQQQLPAGESGMICIHGPQVMLGYLNNPQKTASALQTIAGKIWYLSGDKGYLDEDNFLYIEDRYSRFAKIGGEMISLSFVEMHIRRITDDIELELVAISVPHPKKGESIIVLSNRELQQQALRKDLLEAGIGSLALPSAYFLVDDIPKLGSGKTDFGSAKKLALRLAEIGDRYGKAKDN
jgi:acyl-[acyl-carrier-protein]-phospholipid O-acyltransferase/long-chain-fatty-acid--[acyl-carrier-protein] ligase